MMLMGIHLNEWKKIQLLESCLCLCLMGLKLETIKFIVDLLQFSLIIITLPILLFRSTISVFASFYKIGFYALWIKFRVFLK